jgi:hypothetical protein
MLQIYTNYFIINKEYQQILNKVNSNSIVFIYKEKDNNTTEAPLYINNNKDIDNIDKDLEDRLLLDSIYTTRTIKEI